MECGDAPEKDKTQKAESTSGATGTTNTQATDTNSVEDDRTSVKSVGILSFIYVLKSLVDDVLQ